METIIFNVSACYKNLSISLMVRLLKTITSCKSYNAIGGCYDNYILVFDKFVDQILQENALQCPLNQAPNYPVPI